MKCPQCNAVVDDDTIFCGNCGKQITPLQAGETVVSYATQSDGNPIGVNVSRPSSMYRPPSAAQSQRPASAPDTSRQGDTPPLQTPPPQSQARSGNLRRVALIAIVILVIVAGGTVGLITLLKNNHTPAVVTSHGTGQVTFFDSQNNIGHTDALKIQISGLQAPSAGSQYDAWLINDTTSEQVTSLGTLVGKNGQFSLNFPSNGQGGQPGTNLIGAGNKLEITQEQGNVQLPTGKVVLAGTFPPLAFVHIRHLLFSFPITPNKIGLLVGVLNQTQLLNAQAVLLQSFVANRNQNAIPCVAQSIIDIIDGSQGPHFQPLPTACASQSITATGDGFGLLGPNAYIQTASTHAALAANQSDSTDNIRLFAGHIETAMSNINGWVTSIEQDALNLLSNPTNTTKVQEMVTLANHAFNDDPTSGKAGATTAYLQGQMMANLPLVPVS